MAFTAGAARAEPPFVPRASGGPLATIVVPGGPGVGTLYVQGHLVPAGATFIVDSLAGQFYIDRAPAPDAAGGSASTPPGPRYLCLEGCDRLEQLANRSEVEGRGEGQIPVRDSAIPTAAIADRAQLAEEAASEMLGRLYRAGLSDKVVADSCRKFARAWRREVASLVPEAGGLLRHVGSPSVVHMHLTREFVTWVDSHPPPAPRRYSDAEIWLSWARFVADYLSGGSTMYMEGVGSCRTTPRRPWIRIG